MRMAVFLGLLASLGLPASAQSSKDDVRDDRCDIVTAYANALLFQISDRVLFTAEGEQAYSRLNAKGWFSEKGDHPIAPPASLLREANRWGRVDALSKCHKLANDLKKMNKRNIVQNSKIIEVDRVSGKFLKNIEISITFPVLSNDKKRAILFSSQVSGRMAGGSYAYYMVLNDNHVWVVLSSKILTAS